MPKEKNIPGFTPKEKQIQEQREDFESKIKAGVTGFLNKKETTIDAIHGKAQKEDLDRTREKIEDLPLPDKLIIPLKGVGVYKKFGFTVYKEEGKSEDWRALSAYFQAALDVLKSYAEKREMWVSGFDAEESVGHWKQNGFAICQVHGPMANKNELEKLLPEIKERAKEIFEGYKKEYKAKYQN